MTTHAVRCAMNKGHVKAFYNEQMQVLREGTRPGNIHALLRVRNDDRNAMAVVQAARTLEQLADDDQGRGRSVTSIAPGLVIQIVNNNSSPREPEMINITPAAPPTDASFEP